MTEPDKESPQPPRCLNCQMPLGDHRSLDAACPKGHWDWADTKFSTTAYSVAAEESPQKVKDFRMSEARILDRRDKSSISPSLEIHTPLQPHKCAEIEGGCGHEPPVEAEAYPCRNPNHACADGSPHPHQIGPSCMAESPSAPQPPEEDDKKLLHAVNWLAENYANLPAYPLDMKTGKHADMAEILYKYAEARVQALEEAANLLNSLCCAVEQSCRQDQFTARLHIVCGEARKFIDQLLTPKPANTKGENYE